MAIFCSGVAVDSSHTVDRIDYEVKVAIVIKIRTRGTVRFERTRQSPAFICLSKSQVAAVAKNKITDLDRGHLIDDLLQIQRPSRLLRFQLFDALSVGSQIGGTLSDVAITATQGVFSSRLDFGANVAGG